jgi:hypothetical protein
MFVVVPDAVAVIVGATVPDPAVTDWANTNPPMSFPVVVSHSTISAAAPNVIPDAANPSPLNCAGVVTSVGMTPSPRHRSPAARATDPSVADHAAPADPSAPVAYAAPSDAPAMLGVTRTIWPAEELPDAIATDTEPDSPPAAVFVNACARIGPVSAPVAPVVDATDPAAVHPEGVAAVDVPGLIPTSRTNRSPATAPVG